MFVVVGSNAARRNRRAIGNIFILANTEASSLSAAVVSFEYLECGTIIALLPNSNQLGTRVETTGERMLGGGAGFDTVMFGGVMVDMQAGGEDR